MRHQPEPVQRPDDTDGPVLLLLLHRVRSGGLRAQYASPFIFTLDPAASIFRTVSFTDDAKPVLRKPSASLRVERKQASAKKEGAASIHSSYDSASERKASTPPVALSRHPSRTAPNSPGSSQKSLLSPPGSSLPQSPVIPRQSVEKSVESRASSAPEVTVYSDLEMYDFAYYASIFFQREKSRLFHQFSLSELVSYTGRIPLQPLHPLSSLYVPVVLDLERKVLMWMMIVMVGEADGTNTVEEQRRSILEQVAYQSISSQEIFDEVLCFVMKQSNKNPDGESEVAGFQCLYVLIRQRHPSRALLKYLLNYVHQRIGRDDVVGGLACMIELELLNDRDRGDASAFDMACFESACKEMEEGEKHIIARELFDGVSVSDVIRVENTAEVLLLHGLLPPSGNCYAWHSEIRRCEWVV